MSSNNFCFHMWSNVQGWHVWYGVCKVHANDSFELRIIKFTSLNATKSYIKSHENVCNIYIYIMKDTTLEDLTMLNVLRKLEAS